MRIFLFYIWKVVPLRRDFFTFQHLEVLFQSRRNVYLQSVVPSKKAFSRFNTWKFYFNLGETWTSRKVFILFCISTLVKWNSEERLLHFNSWWNVPPKRSLFCLHFNSGEVKSRRAVITLQLLVKWASEEGFYFLAFQLWWSEIPKSGHNTSTPGEMGLRRGLLFCLHFNSGGVKFRRAVITLQLLVKCASERVFIAWKLLSHGWRVMTPPIFFVE